MANEEQLEILRRGVDVWNAWREEHSGIQSDLRRADLTGANLTGANLTGADLQRTNLERADLYRANLKGANLEGADLYRANLKGADLTGANLEGADLHWADLHWANLQEARLQDAILIEVNLYRADLNRADLQEARLHGTDLRGANLIGVNLTRVNLTGADLTGADLTGADLTGADLTGAIFHGADLTGANMSAALFGQTVFGDIDLRTVQGLDTAKHQYPSTIGIDTLYRSHGNISEVFLRGCGVPDSMIEYARSLVTAERPLDYYSVFISYSSSDEAVAKRLHADLQARGVRCWFAPHDLEIGTPIVRGIDEAIRLYDKLLIILSAASVQSRWVEFEVSTALHRELEQDRTMLFPIRLDDTVLHTPSGWAAQLRTRHIADFRSWKDHDRYQDAFTRLLRDLQAKDSTPVQKPEE